MTSAPWATAARRVRGALALMALAAALGGPAGAWAQPIADEVQRLLERGRPGDAMARADEALAVNPRDARTRFVHAVVLMELGRDAEAFAAFEALSQEFPELPDPLNNLALLHARAGRLDEARRLLEQALRSDPGHRAARGNLGEVHLMLAAEAWARLERDAPLEPRLARRLEAVRSLLGPGAGAPAR